MAAETRERKRKQGKTSNRAELGQHTSLLDIQRTFIKMWSQIKRNPTGDHYGAPATQELNISPSNPQSQPYLEIMPNQRL